ncbi:MULTISPECIES: hypothetical protein [Streptococcus]|nr:MULTISPECIES: hypothetical protein [Streptococcus]
MSGKDEQQGITLYHHDQRRSGLVVQESQGAYSAYAIAVQGLGAKRC